MKNEDGYLVIDNFLDSNSIEELAIIFNKNNAWERKNQIREKHYDHVFRDSDKLTPDPFEIYSSAFWRSEQLEKDPYLKSLYQENIIKKLELITNNEFKNFDLRCHKMLDGDYYRSHCDDYAADIGLILYLSQNWKYDWGGILNISKNEEVVSIVPKYNRAVIIWHKDFRLQHCVSHIADYALEPRYSLTTFNRTIE